MPTKRAYVEWRHVTFHQGSLCSIMLEVSTIRHTKFTLGHRNASTENDQSENRDKRASRH